MSATESTADQNGGLTDENMALPGQPLPGSDLEARPQRATDRPGHREPHAHAAEQPFRVPAGARVRRARLDAAPRLSRTSPAERVGERALAAPAHGQEPQGAEGGAGRAAARRPGRRTSSGTCSERATMSMLIPPQMINTMNERRPVGRPGAPLHAAGVRRPATPTGRSHPHSQRDSLHEAEMWAVEGLTHRYPTKVLAELLSTCPQYCGHCTRMDLVGNDVPQVDEATSSRSQQQDRYDADPRVPAQDAVRCATWWCRAATSPTCRSSSSSRSSARCSTSRTSATSGWRPRG